MQFCRENDLLWQLAWSGGAREGPEGKAEEVRGLAEGEEGEGGGKEEEEEDDDQHAIWNTAIQDSPLKVPLLGKT